jgi:Amt family ammonium transporter
MIPATVFAQAESTPLSGSAAPIFWYVLAAALALFVPAGLVLIGVSGLPGRQAWDTALGALGAIGVVAAVYWFMGFALQFGGIGLVYPQAELRALVWEWSPLPADWGMGWGMAGLSGWMLSGANVTALTYGLFLSHLPWVMTSTALVVMSLRGRAPALVTLLIAVLVGGIVYPLAGNWVQGGGWLNALGRNLNLGHGFVDFGGAGTVFLVAAGFAMAALIVWRQAPPIPRHEPPTVQLPLLAVVGALVVLAGGAGWLWSNPLQVSVLSDVALLRGSLNVVLSAGGGSLIPLVYTWFVRGESHPTLSARGLVAGLIAGLALGPFVQPGAAFLTGVLAGLTVPFVTYTVDSRLGLNDATGILSAAGLPAVIGLLMVGLLADGVAGVGWQMTGLEGHMGVTGQGVSGLLVARGFAPDFPAQFQAQLIGTVALGLWGLLTGLAVCVPLGLLTHNLERSANRRAQRREEATIASANVAVPLAEAESRLER